MTSRKTSPLSIPPWANRFINTWQQQQLNHLARGNSAQIPLFHALLDPSSNSTSASRPTPIPESDRRFKKCPEAFHVEGVSQGTLTHHKEWGNSVVYPGTLRDFQVWLPANVQPGESLGLIVVPDGLAAWEFATQITSVLDNLIHARRIPRVALVLVGVGWEPATGAVAMEPKELFPASMPGYLQRFRELDVLSTEYGSMIVDEMLPWIENEHNVVLSQDPSLRCIAGQSSGGMCAFNVAWTRPELFGAVLGVSTSFCNSMAGYLLPREVRLTKKKPLRVALLVGEHDVASNVGNWCEHTQLMGAALEFKGYDAMVEVAKGGGHTLRYTGARLASVLEWLFVDKSVPTQTNTEGMHKISKL